MEGKIRQMFRSVNVLLVTIVFLRQLDAIRKPGIWSQTGLGLNPSSAPSQLCDLGHGSSSLQLRHFFN